MTRSRARALDIINAINLGRPIPVADGFTGDVITLDAAIDSSFPNGRRLGGGTAPNRNQVNVNSVLISLIVAGDPAAGLAKGVEVNDKDYLDRFPFLAPAHQGLFQGHGGINVPTVPNIPPPGGRTSQAETFRSRLARASNATRQSCSERQTLRHVRPRGSATPHRSRSACIREERHDVAVLRSSPFVARCDSPWCSH